MAYTPTQWGTGDTITASALNKIEQGVADSRALIVDWSGSGASPLSKTVQEIYDAFSSGIPVYLRYGYGDPAKSSSQDITYVASRYLAPITIVSRYGDEHYAVCAMHHLGNYSQMTMYVVWFTSSTFSGYPTYSGDHNYPY